MSMMRDPGSQVRAAPRSEAQAQDAQTRSLGQGSCSSFVVSWPWRWWPMDRSEPN